MKLNVLLVVFVLAVALVRCGKEEKEVPPFSLEGGEECDQNVVCIVRTVVGNSLQFTIKTFPNTSVTVSVNPTLENMQASAGLPYVASLDGDKLHEAFTIEAIDPRSAYTYGYSFQWAYGVMNATHNDAINYELPFTGSRTAAQGYDGTFSHFNALKYSLDFSMPEGTDVLAARAGTVINVIESYTQASSDSSYADKANKVMVLHDDNTIGEYLHLQKDGALVNRGDKVTAGAVIGKSGNTGWSTAPHLHFHVARRLSVTEFTTIQTKFKTSTSASTAITAGQAYAHH